MEFHWSGVASQGSHELDAIRHAVEARLEAAAPGNRNLWRMIQAVDELCSNCMRHAYGMGVPGMLQIEVSRDDGELRVLVEDVGQPFRGTLERTLDVHATDEGRFGGLGIALTRMLVNEMRYERIGTTNRWTVVLDLAAPPAGGKPRVAVTA